MSAAGIAAVNTVVATDTDLVAAVRLGDDLAFEELYRRYYPRVAAFVRGYVRDSGRSEDVTQEAFMSALRRLRQTDAPINFKPWLFEIARNAAIDQYRRNVRTDEVSIEADGGFAPAEASRLVRPRGPDSSMLDKERLDHLRGALAELSETHHRIIVMRELEGLSYREIGKRMELTPAAVESTLFRARRKLQHEYALLDTGRRCQLIGAVIGRLAEGLDSDRDRRRLDRHARRCSSCRCRARQLGVEPILPRRSLVARAAALLPLPAFARRRFDGDAAGSVTASAQHAAPIGAIGAPTVEMGAAVAGKVVAVVAAVALVGGGGATLGGAGPLDLGGDGKQAIETQRGRSTAPRTPALERDASAYPRRLQGSKARPGPKAPRGSDQAPPRVTRPAAPSKPKPEPTDGLGALPPVLLNEAGANPPADEPTPIEEPASSQLPIEPPAVSPGASAPPATSPAGAITPQGMAAAVGMD